MSTVTIEPLLRYSGRETPLLLPCRTKKILKPSLINFSSPKNLLLSNYGSTTTAKTASFCNFKRTLPRRCLAVRASSTDAALVETFKSADVFCKETFSLSRTETVEEKIFARLDKGEKGQRFWQLSIGCSLPGKWILHWGVSYVDDVGSEWDQPPKNMRPPGSVPIKDYAMETPLKKLSGENMFHEVNIDLDPKSSIAAIHFVLKNEETGAWYRYSGRDFKVPLVDYLLDSENVVGAKKGFSIWQGAFLPKMLLKAEASPSKDENSSTGTKDVKQENRQLEGFYEEHPIVKQVTIQNLATVSVTKCSKSSKNLLYLETDLLGEVVVHWGACRDDAKNWEIPAGPHPPETTLFRNKALRTKLQPKVGGNGHSGLFALDEEFSGFLFVLKLNESTWLKYKGNNDFYVPLSSSSGLPDQPRQGQSEGVLESAPLSSSSGLPDQLRQGQSEGVLESAKAEEANQEVSHAAYTDGILSEIRNLVNGISCHFFF